MAEGELMVHASWQSTGLARRIHEELLQGRTEERVTLLVDPDHPTVKTLHKTWEYHSVEGRQPFPGASTYATWLRQLH